MEENGNEVVTDEVLSEFRNQWKQELNSEINSLKVGREKSLEEEARALFQQGVDLERKGKCFEAIKHYRKAIHLVPDIEFRVYSTTQQKQKVKDDRNGNKVKAGSSKQFEGEVGDGVDDLVEAFQRDLCLNNLGVCESSLGAGTISTSLHISALPVEVFIVILKWLVSNDLDFKSLERFGQVCKGFYLLSRDQEIWRLACLKVWGGNVSPSSSMTWREMFLTRPRVNFNGCYISKINYQRYGENSFQDQFYRPVQIVEYFRLIRFLPNGTTLMLTSADELQTSVNKLKNVQNALQSNDSSILKGHYHYQDSTIFIMIKKQLATNQKFKRKNVTDENLFTFFLELEITDTPRKKFTKLMWKNYSITHFRNGDDFSSDFDLSSSSMYPPFYFSPVRSFHAETNECLQV
jgi:F-box protein 9